MLPSPPPGSDLDAADEVMPAATYVELVRSIFHTLLPSVIMTMLFVAVGELARHRTGDGIVTALLVLGTLVSAARLAVMIGGRGRVEDPRLDRYGASVLERALAAPYIGFAAVLGAFGVRLMLLPDTELHMLGVVLLVGYSAGVAAGAHLRPWISVTSILLAVVPGIAAAAAVGDTAHVMLAAMLAALMIGGLLNLVARYRDDRAKIELRHRFAAGARHDVLTRLPNRLALGEAHDLLRADMAGGDLLALHYLDLDGFKPVNDRHGHPVGDALLQMVAGRLLAAETTGGTVARLGGDEFVVLQAGLGHPGEADLFARRLVRALAEPYIVAGVPLFVGASIGYAARGPEASLAELMRLADDALLHVKRTGRGTTMNNDALGGALLATAPAPESSLASFEY